MIYNNSTPTGGSLQDLAYSIADALNERKIISGRIMVSRLDLDTGIVELSASYREDKANRNLTTKLIYGLTPSGSLLLSRNLVDRPRHLATPSKPPEKWNQEEKIEASNHCRALQMRNVVCGLSEELAEKLWVPSDNELDKARIAEAIFQKRIDGDLKFLTIPKNGDKELWVESPSLGLVRFTSEKMYAGSHYTLGDINRFYPPDKEEPERITKFYKICLSIRNAAVDVCPRMKLWGPSTLQNHNPRYESPSAG